MSSAADHEAALPLAAAAEGEATSEHLSSIPALASTPEPVVDAVGVAGLGRRARELAVVELALTMLVKCFDRSDSASPVLQNCSAAWPRTCSTQLS
jgi:hypothetical protein